MRQIEQRAVLAYWEQVLEEPALVARDRGRTTRAGGYVVPMFRGAFVGDIPLFQG